MGSCVVLGGRRGKEKPPRLMEHSPGSLQQLLTGRTGGGRASPAHGGRCFGICEIPVSHTIFI